MRVQIWCTDGKKGGLTIALAEMFKGHEAHWNISSATQTKEERDSYDTFVVIVGGKERDKATATSIIAANLDDRKNKSVIVIATHSDGEALRILFHMNNDLHPWFHVIESGLSDESAVGLVEKFLFRS